MSRTSHCQCHCEERSDEAIAMPRPEDRFAALAMTFERDWQDWILNWVAGAMLTLA